MTNARSYPGTYGTCNSTCAEPYSGGGNSGTSTCTGTATVTVTEEQLPILIF